MNPNYSYLGASIDSFVSCQVCGCGIVEIKCPYGSDKDETPWRKRQPQQCAVDVKFCCELENGKLKLKGNHKYMFQVQGQMALYNVVWSSMGRLCCMDNKGNFRWKNIIWWSFMERYAFQA